MIQINEENLFSNDPSTSGFRLHYLEVLNWGTFDKNIYKIEPNGKNSLLTGDNGSGKSTLIDALLTLLVPYDRQRFYNQSSGSISKKDRSVRSYILGNYGVGMTDDSQSLTDLKLRDYNCKSVLCACFKNESENSVVTIFQIRYFKGLEIMTIYGIAKVEMHIKEDILSGGKSVADWKNNLLNKYNTGRRETVITISEGSPKSYAARLCEVFRLGQNAFTLFNQIVGVKVLHDLNDFIRYNMLETKDVEEQYKELRKNYYTVLDTEKSLEYAQKQNELLRDLITTLDNQKTADAKILSKKKELGLMKYCFKKACESRINSELLSLEEKKATVEDSLNKCKKERKDLEEQRDELLRLQGTMDINTCIMLLNQRIEHLELTKSEKLSKRGKYDKTISELGLPAVKNSEMFQTYRIKSSEELHKLEELQNDFGYKKSQYENIKREYENNQKELKNEIEILRHSGNQISDQTINKIRKDIIQEVGASDDEIPFIGELIKVRDCESSWINSIEKILHNFGLRIIIPEKYYRKVNEYVNNNNLKGRIVYQLYTEDPMLCKEVWNKNPTLLYNKLDFKPGSVYTKGEWLQNMIYKKYNYTCVDSIKELEICENNAVTREGLIKSEIGKHEKDDREKRFNDFVLGWDNKEKLSSLFKEYSILNEKIRKTNNEIEDIQNKLDEANTKVKKWNVIIDQYYTYNEIDYSQDALQIDEIQKKIISLKRENPEYTDLSNKIKMLKDRINEKDNEKSHFTSQKEEFKRTQKYLQELDIKKELNFDDGLQSEIKPEIDAEYINPEVENEYSCASEMLKVFLKELDLVRSEIRKLLTVRIETKDNLKSQIIEFKRPNKDIKDKFERWEEDVKNLPSYDDEKLEALEEYRILFINNENKIIPESEERFAKYLRTDIFRHVSDYRNFFDNWERDIENAIERLNEPLKSIIYSSEPETYIQIKPKKIGDKDIKDFRRVLEDAHPNINQITSAPLETVKEHFDHKIKPLIDILEKESWRQKVTDVRRWFNFTVGEYRKSDDSRYKIYEKMGQLSGGEKAQLTYSILGSAISYQFRLSRTGRDSSFRFIAIDEAFKAQDDNKSKYLISLCNQLHLQLLVVTPSNNMHIVENDIDYVHLVERIDEHSVIRNMTINKYKQIKKANETDDKFTRNIKKSE